MRRPRHVTARARTEASRFRSLLRRVMHGVMKAAARNAVQRVLEERIGRPLNAEELAALSRAES